MASSAAVEVEPAPARAAEATAAGFRSVPVGFARSILGHDPWSMPVKIMRAMVEPHARVAVKACHASAKTHTAADIVLWWVACGGICVTTAPTWTQVEKLLWGEIHRAYKGARFPFGGQLHQTELRLTPDAYAIGLSTNEGVRFQGWHGKRVLLVIDEAPGVRAEIWEAIEGVRAGGDVRVLALGNPTIAAGPFYDAFTKDRAGWTTFTINAFETPNLAGVSVEQLLAMGGDELDRVERAYLVTRRWVREKHEDWGPGNPLYESRVLGQFPSQSEYALVSLDWLEAAKLRPAVDAGGLVTAGVDVAGPGDDESAVKVQGGGNLLAEGAWREADARGSIVAFLAPWKARLAAVHVDEIGIGYHMATHLRDQGFPVVGVNVGAAAREVDRFVNLKAEVSWSFREMAKAGQLAGLTDETTIAQLAGIQWREDSRGRIAIESKDAARKRGIKSPDRADALILACIPARDAAAGAIAPPSAAPAAPAPRLGLMRPPRRLFGGGR